MNSSTLFNMALGLELPWQVNDSVFAAGECTSQELHLHVGVIRDSFFPDERGVLCPVHDTVERVWQHLNIFEHNCFLHCAVPRIKTAGGQVVAVDVPWSRPDSGFTLI